MTITQAMDNAKALALATGRCYSVRRQGKGFIVRAGLHANGMFGTVDGRGTYTAWPETLDRYFRVKIEESL